MIVVWCVRFCSGVSTPNFFIKQKKLEVDKMDYEMHTVCLFCGKWLEPEEEKSGIAFCSSCYEMYREVAWKVH